MKYETIKKRLVKELQRENLAIFAGAGLSKGAGYPDWRELLAEFAEELDLSSDKETDLISLAQYSYNNNSRNRNDINVSIINKFQDEHKISNDMEILAKLPISTFWTTNYDGLIEQSLRRINKRVDIKRREKDLSNYIDDRDAVVYKMHGDVTEPEKAVIIRDDYEEYDANRKLFIDTLCGELISKTFLFIGYSFNDPNFEKILSRIRINLKGNLRKHYAFIKKINKNDFDNQDDYKYDEIKQKLRIEDLKNYGIHCIQVEEFSEITKILTELKEELYKNNIFISGSAYEYGENWTSQDVALFIRGLAEKIIHNNNKLVTGYGLGIGGFVIEGSSNAIFAEELDVNKYFEIHPFPQKMLDNQQNMQETWNGYRNKIISKCSTAIFVFGNKMSSNEVVNANGVLNEFKIAKDLGLKIIPVGITGYASKLIFDEVKDNIQDYKYLEEYLEVLDTCLDAKELTKVILEIINK